MTRTRHLDRNHLWGGWGSTTHEQHRRLPGDDLIAEPTVRTTHAITLPARVDDVWPWLIQMGYGRGGWYTPPWVDRVWRVTNPSATNVRAELQHLEPGDEILDGPPGTAVFEVVDIQQPHALVLRSRRHPYHGRPPDLASADPGPYLEFSWAFVLEPCDDGSRLLLRTRGVATPSWLTRLARTVLHAADLAMGRWMLLGIRRRVESGGYELSLMPASRRVALEASKSTRRDAVSGLFECDVTEALTRIRQHEETSGERLSFTAFVCHAVANALGDHPAANSVRGFRNRVVEFGDVDVLAMVEATVDDRSLPIGVIIRQCNEKSIFEVHRELRDAQANPMAGQAGRYIRLGQWMPRLLLHTLIRIVDRNPFWSKRIKGTASVSAVGMFAQGGWGIAGSHHTVSVIVGGMAKRPAMTEDGITERHYLNLTLTVDHDLIDGAPAARLARDIQGRIESAEGLPTLIRPR